VQTLLFVGLLILNFFRNIPFFLIINFFLSPELYYYVNICLNNLLKNRSPYNVFKALLIMFYNSFQYHSILIIFILHHTTCFHDILKFCHLNILNTCNNNTNIDIKTWKTKLWLHLWLLLTLMHPNWCQISQKGSSDK